MEEREGRGGVAVVDPAVAGGAGWGYGTVAGGHLDRVTCWTCDGSGVEPATAIAA